MNKRNAPVVALALLGWLALAGVSLAQGGPTIGWSVIGGGGASASGGNVTLNSTLGQTANGPVGGGTITAGAGYWVASAVEPAVNVEGAVGGAELWWTHLEANAGGYEVYWSTAPYFTPDENGLDHATVKAPPWSYTHNGDPGVNYYYVVLGVNAIGQKSQISNRTGRFNFDLTPGTAGIE